jgi:response regulator RpfG family c-di-GMP phosphodiesterase
VESRIKVLVVDDEEMIREFIISVVGIGFPAHFFEAASGKQAIEILKNNDIDIVLCDYNMPNGNGRTVFQHVKTMSSQPKFLLITSEEISKITDIVTQPGCGHLDKPFDCDQLNRQISYLLDIIPVEKGVSEFVNIKKELLVCIDPLPFDLFIQLKESHYIKYINGGHSLSVTDKERFDKFQNNSFFVKTDLFYQYIVKQQRTVFQSSLYPKEGIDHKFTMAEIENDLVGLGLSKFVNDKELMALTQKNLKTVFALSYKVKALNGLLDWVDKSDLSPKKLHSVLLTLFCNIILKNLQTVFDFNSYLNLSYVAVLHDINLDDYLVQNEYRIMKSLDIKSHINKFEQDTVIEHITKLMPIVKNWVHCPQEVLDMIESHHEKPDGSGFPKHLTGDKIVELAAVFNVAHDMTALIWERKTEDELKKSISNLSKLYSGYKQFEEPLRILAKEIFLK